MSYSLSTLEPIVQDRLEESGSGLFWDLATELRILLVESLCAASVITGETQFRLSPSVAVTQNTTLQDTPDSLIAISKIEGASGAIQKATVFDLDNTNPNWQNEVGTAPKRWFPFGLTKWGIYPKLTVPYNVVLSGLQTPAPTTRPYDGSETIYFPTEFQLAFINYASGWARLKETGLETQQGAQDYDAFLDQMFSLARFSIRKGSLRFSKAMGLPAQVTERTKT